MSAPADLTDVIDIAAAEPVRSRLVEAMTRTRTLLSGHFALYRDRHATTALRFRGVGRDEAARGVVLDALLAGAPAELRAALPHATLLTPESSGFFLGKALADRHHTRHVVVQTDLRRIPTKRLLAGAIAANDRVVLVNDVASTGVSLNVMRELVTERNAIVAGVLLFAAVGGPLVADYCATWHLPVHWLVTARWPTYPSGACPGCTAGTPLVPIAEFA